MPLSAAPPLPGPTPLPATAAGNASAAPPRTSVAVSAALVPAAVTGVLRGGAAAGAPVLATTARTHGLLLRLLPTLDPRVLAQCAWLAPAVTDRAATAAAADDADAVVDGPVLAALRLGLPLPSGRAPPPPPAPPARARRPATSLLAALADAEAASATEGGFALATPVWPPLPLALIAPRAEPQLASAPVALPRLAAPAVASAAAPMLRWARAGAGECLTAAFAAEDLATLDAVAAAADATAAAAVAALVDARARARAAAVAAVSAGRSAPVAGVATTAADDAGARVQRLAAASLGLAWRARTALRQSTAHPDWWLAPPAVAAAVAAVAGATATQALAAPVLAALADGDRPLLNGAIRSAWLKNDPLSEGPWVLRSDTSHLTAARARAATDARLRSQTGGEEAASAATPLPPPDAAALLREATTGAPLALVPAGACDMGGFTLHPRLQSGRESEFARVRTAAATAAAAAVADAAVARAIAAVSTPPLLLPAENALSAGLHFGDCECGCAGNAYLSPVSAAESVLLAEDQQISATAAAAALPAAAAGAANARGTLVAHKAVTAALRSRAYYDKGTGHTVHALQLAAPLAQTVGVTGETVSVAAALAAASDAAIAAATAAAAGSAGAGMSARASACGRVGTSFPLPHTGPLALDNCGNTSGGMISIAAARAVLSVAPRALPLAVATALALITLPAVFSGDTSVLPLASAAVAAAALAAAVKADFGPDLPDALRLLLSTAPVRRHAQTHMLASSPPGLGAVPAWALGGVRARIAAAVELLHAPTPAVAACVLESALHWAASGVTPLCRARHAHGRRSADAGAGACACWSPSWPLWLRQRAGRVSTLPIAETDSERRSAAHWGVEARTAPPAATAAAAAATATAAASAAGATAADAAAAASAAASTVGAGALAFLHALCVRAAYDCADGAPDARSSAAPLVDEVAKDNVRGAAAAVAGGLTYSHATVPLPPAMDALCGPDMRGLSPLMLAASRGDADAARVLLHFGARLCRDDVIVLTLAFAPASAELAAAATPADANEDDTSGADNAHDSTAGDDARALSRSLAQAAAATRGIRALSYRQMTHNTVSLSRPATASATAGSTSARPLSRHRRSASDKPFSALTTLAAADGERQAVVSVAALALRARVAASNAGMVGYHPSKHSLGHDKRAPSLTPHPSLLLPPAQQRTLTAAASSADSTRPATSRATVGRADTSSALSMSLSRPTTASAARTAAALPQLAPVRLVAPEDAWGPLLTANEATATAVAAATATHSDEAAFHMWRQRERLLALFPRAAADAARRCEPYCTLSPLLLAARPVPHSAVPAPLSVVGYHRAAAAAHAACVSGAAPALVSPLRAFPVLTALTVRGLTLAHVAAWHGHERVLQLLMRVAATSAADAAGSARSTEAAAAGAADVAGALGGDGTAVDALWWAAGAGAVAAARVRARAEATAVTTAVDALTLPSRGCPDGICASRPATATAAAGWSLPSARGRSRSGTAPAPASASAVGDPRNWAWFSTGSDDAPGDITAVAITASAVSAAATASSAGTALVALRARDPLLEHPARTACCDSPVAATHDSADEASQYAAARYATPSTSATSDAAVVPPLPLAALVTPLHVALARGHGHLAPALVHRVLQTGDAAAAAALLTVTSPAGAPLALPLEPYTVTALAQAAPVMAAAAAGLLCAGWHLAAAAEAAAGSASLPGLARVLLLAAEAARGAHALESRVLGWVCAGAPPVHAPGPALPGLDGMLCARLATRAVPGAPTVVPAAGHVAHRLLVAARSLPALRLLLTVAPPHRVPRSDGGAAAAATYTAALRRSQNRNTDGGSDADSGTCGELLTLLRALRLRGTCASGAVPPLALLTVSATGARAGEALCAAALAPAFAAPGPPLPAAAAAAGAAAAAAAEVEVAPRDALDSALSLAKALRLPGCTLPAMTPATFAEESVEAGRGGAVTRLLTAIAGDCERAGSVVPGRERAARLRARALFPHSVASQATAEALAPLLAPTLPTQAPGSPQQHAWWLPLLLQALWSGADVRVGDLFTRLVPAAAAAASPKTWVALLLALWGWRVAAAEALLDTARDSMREAVRGAVRRSEEAKAKAKNTHRRHHSFDDSDPDADGAADNNESEDDAAVEDEAETEAAAPHVAAAALALARATVLLGSLIDAPAPALTVALARAGAGAEAVASVRGAADAAAAWPAALAAHARATRLWVAVHQFQTQRGSRLAPSVASEAAAVATAAAAARAMQLCLLAGAGYDSVGPEQQWPRAAAALAPVLGHASPLVAAACAAFVDDDEGARAGADAYWDCGCSSTACSRARCHSTTPAPEPCLCGSGVAAKCNVFATVAHGGLYAVPRPVVLVLEPSSRGGGLLARLLSSTPASALRHQQQQQQNKESQETQRVPLGAVAVNASHFAPSANPRPRLRPVTAQRNSRGTAVPGSRPGTSSGNNSNVAAAAEVLLGGDARGLLGALATLQRRSLQAVAGQRHL